MGIESNQILHDGLNKYMILNTENAEVGEIYTIVHAYILEELQVPMSTDPCKFRPERFKVFGRDMSTYTRISSSRSHNHPENGFIVVLLCKLDPTDAHEQDMFWNA